MSINGQANATSSSPASLMSLMSGMLFCVLNAASKAWSAYRGEHRMFNIYEYFLALVSYGMHCTVM
jgi:hypothetical protein